MADETITGCFNPETGRVVFTQESLISGSPDCLYGITCYVADDSIHNGQIALTMDTPNCEDTYYGCFDPVSGEFEVTIPDNCCVTSGGGGCGMTCEGQTPPDWIMARISGSAACGCHLDANQCGGGDFRFIEGSGGIDGLYSLVRLNQADSETFCGDPLACCYYNLFTGVPGWSWDFYSAPDCSGVPLCSGTDTTVQITANFFLDGSTPMVGVNTSSFSGAVRNDCKETLTIPNQFPFNLCPDLGSLHRNMNNASVRLSVSLRTWASGQNYPTSDVVESGGILYQCNTAHLSSGANEPPNAVWDAI